MFRNYENKKKKDDEDRRIIADLMSRVTLLTELKRKLREQVANLRKVSTQELETERKHFSDKFRIASEAFVNGNYMTFGAFACMFHKLLVRLSFRAQNVWEDAQIAGHRVWSDCQTLDSAL